jgi:transcriptional regulator with XRE-family HTH domain
MVQYNSREIGKRIAMLREKSGFKQNELAKKIELSPAWLSRVETGDKEVSLEEINSILKTIGTEEAQQAKDQITRHWTHIDRPELDHPDIEILWEAEKAIENLVEFENLKGEELKKPFLERLALCKNELRRIARLIYNRNHTIAFAGIIGAGKTYAICHLANVLSDEKKDPALPHSTSRTTICEVRIKKGPTFGILIDPKSYEEIRDDVEDYVESRLPNSEESNDGDNPVEIQNAIINMANLRQLQKTGDGKERRIEITKQLIEEKITASSNVREEEKIEKVKNAIVSEIMARMELHKRTYTELWYNDTKNGSPMDWIEKAFKEINYGKSEYIALPRRVTMIVPTDILGVSDLNIELVDTRGISKSSPTIRQDLESILFDSEHTLMMLCSRFGEAPSDAVTTIIKRPTDLGLKSIQVRINLLILPQNDEALRQLAYGEHVANEEEGYDVKKEEIENSLKSAGATIVPICFYNAKTDNVEKAKQFIIEGIKKIRYSFSLRLQAGIKAASEIIRLFEEKQTEEIFNTVSKIIENYWIKPNELIRFSNVEIIYNSLLNYIRNAHYKVVKAAIRRQGLWYDLDYTHHLATGAQIYAKLLLESKILKYEDCKNGILNDQDLSDAESLVSQVDSIINERFLAILQKVYASAYSLFSNVLRESSENYWTNCYNFHGTGYKDRVNNETRNLVESNTFKEINEQLDSIISKLWSETIETIRNTIMND